MKKINPVRSSHGALNPVFAKQSTKHSPPSQTARYSASNGIKWANLFHIYQPPDWEGKVIRKVAKESYRPLLAILKKQKKIRLTININGSLTEQLVKLKLNDILTDLKLLARKRRIEFTGSAKYHVILPKLPRAEVVRQIRLNTITNRKYLGAAYRPKGFYLPEMCYSKAVAKIVAQEKFRWLALDEIAYHGKLGKVDWQQGYQIKDLPLKVIFRNRLVSDWFLGKPGQEVKQKVKKLFNQNKPLILAMDGETLGHHRPGMDKVFKELIGHNKVQAITFSDFLKEFSSFKTIVPQASSWASSERELSQGIPYELWQHPENPIHRLQWQLFNLVLKTVLGKKQDPAFKEARTLLDKSINSDPFWWASAHPWWSVEIVEQGAMRLVKTISSLKTVTAPKIKKANKLADRINQLAHRWQQTGKAQREKEKFLARFQKETYLAGRKVT